MSRARVRQSEAALVFIPLELYDPLVVTCFYQITSEFKIESLIIPFLQWPMSSPIPCIAYTFFDCIGSREFV